MNSFEAFEIVNQPHQIEVSVTWYWDPIEIGHDENISQKQQEVLSIVEADAVVDPRTMMIHVQDALFTGWTVMTSFRLKKIAHQTVSSSSPFWISNSESPIDRYLPWISKHCLEEWPNKHSEHYMKYDQEVIGKNIIWVFRKHSCENIVVVS